MTVPLTPHPPVAVHDLSLRQYVVVPADRRTELDR